MHSWLRHRSGVRRRAATLSAVCLALAVSPAASAATTPAHPPQLGAVTEVVGSRTSSERVRLLRPAHLDRAALKAAVTITGAGRARGVALVREGDDAFKRPLLFYVTTSFCGEPGCGPDEDPPATSATRDDTAGDGVLRLPAGMYRLYLIADRDPLKVTLRLPGQRGKSTIRPTTPAGPGPIVPSNGVDVSPGGAPLAYSGGVDVETRGSESLGIFAMDARKTKQWAYGIVGFCDYPSSPPDPVGYAPGCPTAPFHTRVHDGVINPGVVQFDRSYTGLYYWQGAGLRSFGGYITAASVTEKFSGAAFVLDLMD